MKTQDSKVFRLARKLSEMVGAIMFLAIFAAFLLQVVARYIFHWPLGWPDEAISMLFVWTTFWAAGFCVPYDRQISFDLIQNALPARVRTTTNILSTGICAALFIAAIPITIDFLIFSHRQSTPILDLPLSLVNLPLLFLLVATPVRMVFHIRSLVLELRVGTGRTDNKNYGDPS